MNKEIVIHVIVGATAVAVIYWAWRSIRSSSSTIVNVPGVGATSFDQYMQPQNLSPMATVGVVGSGNAGYTGEGTSDPELPPIFTFH